MISIIICSVNPNELFVVKENIQNTIGVAHEILAIDNRDNKYNIFSAYNEGIRNAKGDVLCFMHEDILFHTQDWGMLVEQHLKDENVGIIGIYGGHYLPPISCMTWWDSPVDGNIIQGHNVYDRYITHEVHTNTQEFSVSTEVVACDGQWLCGKRDLFKKIAFDDKTYTGFHCYDIDICMQAIEKGKKNYVVNDILIEHKSNGSLTPIFYYNLKLFHEKWDKFLPLSRGEKDGLAKFVKKHQTAEDYYVDLFIDRNRMCEDLIYLHTRIEAIKIKIPRCIYKIIKVILK